MPTKTIEEKPTRSAYEEGALQIIYFSPLGTKVRIDSCTDMTFVSVVSKARDEIFKEEALGSYCVQRTLYNSLMKHGA